MEDKMVKLIIDNIEVEVPLGTTVLDAAKKVGIDIPTLCYLSKINNVGACRVCVVEAEVDGKPVRGLPTSCTLKASEGMIVKTNTKKVLDARKINLELILSNHNNDCLSCNRNGDCELQALSAKFDCDVDHYKGDKTESIEDLSSVSIVRDPSKCILCRRCVSVCNNIQGIGALDVGERGFETMVGPALLNEIASSNCINCGQCVKVCPTGALSIKNDTDRFIEALNDPDKIVIVQTAPSVRVGLAEEFGMEVGTIATGKMVEALKRMGVSKVFDTNYTADLTIIEEAYEFIDRVKNNGKLPMFTSCCPSWVYYVEKNYPEMLDNLSSCKSPQGMMGALIKKYYANIENIDPSKIVSVSLMPCVSKKHEILRPEFSGDIDIVITTREFARVIKKMGIDFENLGESEFDRLLGNSSGAGAIFGASGGVMEAALRTVAESILEVAPENVDYKEVRGFDDIREATLNLDGLEVNVAVTSGLDNARKLIEKTKSGEKVYHFIEVMACPGGCINGGGQPLNKDADYAKTKRGEAIYKIDSNSNVRKSHENSDILSLYKDFIGKPNGERAHELFHTKYEAKEKYKKD